MACAREERSSSSLRHMHRLTRGRDQLLDPAVANELPGQSHAYCRRQARRATARSVAPAGRSAGSGSSGGSTTRSTR